jgi:hypothetical protein
MIHAPTLFAGLLGGAACAHLFNRWRTNIMAASIADFVTEVEQTETVVDSAVALITGLSDRIKELVAANAGLDAFAALAERLDTATDKLAGAVASVTLDTPAEPVAEDATAGTLVDVPAPVDAPVEWETYGGTKAPAPADGATDGVETPPADLA